jgi:serine phosphatase RsbU (regulator of sigma subunit)
MLFSPLVQERRIHRNWKHRIHDSALLSTAEQGDRIVLYTDGITEVFNSKGEMHGIEGI